MRGPLPAPPNDAVAAEPAAPAPIFRAGAAAVEVRDLEAAAKVKECKTDKKAKKQTPTPYFLFSEEQRAVCKAELEAEGSKAGVAQVAKLVGKKWGALSDEEKQQFKDRAQQLRGGAATAAVALAGVASCHQAALARTHSSSRCHWPPPPHTHTHTSTRPPRSC